MDKINREAMEDTLKAYRAQIELLEDEIDKIDHKISLIENKVFDLQYELKGKGR